MDLTVGEAASRPGTGLGADAPLSAAVETMERSGQRRVPVLREGRVVGIVTAGDVRRHLSRLAGGRSAWDFAAALGRTCVEDVMTAPALTAQPDEPLGAAISRMLDAGVEALPVLDPAGGLAGMLTRRDVLRAGVRRARLTWGLVAQQMTRAVRTVAPDTPATEAARELRETGLHVLPVLEGERLVGVIHARDLAAEAERGEAAPGSRSPEGSRVLQGRAVRELMRPPSGYLLESDPLHTALVRMLDRDVYGLPVISEGGRLLGVVTVTDVLSAVAGRTRAPAP
ncbi:HPP family protein [Deinococcus sp. NW-56]|uniref:CBS domain-containing protein n=1 Tax=Deinococcus sp. NW-56 TaxID=2080419 RepID=UPI00131A2A05|nr:CBS domain-containing protein [Deinococcus sp. NW-56]